MSLRCVADCTPSEGIFLHTIGGSLEWWYFFLLLIVPGVAVLIVIIILV